MDKIYDSNINNYLKPGKILENSDYINWLYDFSLVHKSFSSDSIYSFNDLSDKDKEYISKLPIFAISLEYICLVQDVKMYSSYIYERNCSQISIYFMYKGKHFVITKETNTLNSCRVSTMHNTDKNKHKYIILDKIFY